MAQRNSAYRSHGKGALLSSSRLRGRPIRLGMIVALFVLLLLLGWMSRHVASKQQEEQPNTVVIVSNGPSVGTVVNPNPSVVDRGQEGNQNDVAASRDGASRVAEEDRGGVDPVKEMVERIRGQVNLTMKDRMHSIHDALEHFREAAGRVKGTTEGKRRQTEDDSKEFRGGMDGDAHRLHREREAEALAALQAIREGRAGEHGLRSVHVDEIAARRIDELQRSFERERESRMKDRMDPRERILGGADAMHRRIRPDLLPERLVNKDADPNAGPLEDTERRRQIERGAVEQLRRTAFGVALDTPPGDSSDRGSDNAKVKQHSTRAPSLKITFLTTLKSCANESIRFAQLDALTSWAALPVYPAPRIVILGNDPCNTWIAERVNRIHAATFGDATPIAVVRRDVKQGTHGTVLLGSSLRLVMKEFSVDTDVFGFVNGDILLDPISSVALYRIANTYREFFVIGRRKSVFIHMEERTSWMREDPGAFRRKHQQEQQRQPNGLLQREDIEQQLLDFSLPIWSHHHRFIRSVSDRQDAEDFFFWSKTFFSSPDDIPEFHIGRPAYDNWLVHHAIHTWQPVIDASELLVAYHQTHDYNHLQQQQQQPIPDGAATSTYWGAQEQQENYDLGVAHGGWQHGLIDFAPLGFEPAGCSQAIQHNAEQQMRHFHGGRGVMEVKRNKAKMLFDWYASLIETEIALAPSSRSSSDCALKIRTESGWKPLAAGSPYSTVEQYEAQYATFMLKRD